MNKKIVLSFIGALALFSGCGGSSGTSSGGNDGNPNDQPDLNKKIIINGKAIDGYLRYATVCLDLDGDSYCQPNEPFTLTDKDGSFKLDVSQYKDELKNKNLVAFGGQDSDSGAPFSGVVMNRYEKDLSSINITPITTVVTKLQESGVSKEQAKSKVAKLLGVEESKLSSDPIAMAKEDPTILKATLQLQKSVDILVEAKRETSAKDEAKIADEVLDEIAKSLKTTTLDANSDAVTKLTKVIKDAKIGDINSSIVDKVEVVAKGIDEAINEDDFKKSNDITKEVKIATINIHKLKENIKQKDKDSVEDLKDATDIFEKAGIEKVTKSSIEVEYLKNLTKNLEVDDIDFDALVSTLKAKKVDITDLDYKGLKETIEKYSLKDKYSSLYSAILAEVAKQEQKNEDAKISSSEKLIPIKLPFKYYSIDEVELRNDRVYAWSDSFANGIYSEEDYDIDLNSKEITKDNDNDDIDLVLKNGSWQEPPKSFTISSNKKILSIDFYNADLVLKSKTDLSGKTKTLLLDGMDTPLMVKFSKGAQEYKIAYKFNKDFYELGHTKNYNSLEDFINEHTQKNRRFTERDGIGVIFEKEVNKLKIGDSGKLLKVTNLHSGYNNEKISGEAGKWKVEKLPNSNIIALMIYLNDDFDEGEERRFYTMYKGEVAKGHAFKKMSDYRLMEHFTGNEQAIKDIIEVLSKYSSKGDEDSDSNSSSSKTQKPPVNGGNTNDLKALLGGKTWGEYKKGAEYPKSCYIFSGDKIIAYTDGDKSQPINIDYEINGNILKYKLNGDYVSSTDTFSNITSTQMSVHKVWSDDVDDRIWKVTQNCADIMRDDDSLKKNPTPPKDGANTNDYISITQDMLDGKTFYDFYKEEDVTDPKTCYGKNTFSKTTATRDEECHSQNGGYASQNQYDYEIINGKLRVDTKKGYKWFTLSSQNENEWKMINDDDDNKDGIIDSKGEINIWYLKRPDFFPAQSTNSSDDANGSSGNTSMPANPGVDPNDPENGGGESMQSENDQILQQFMAQFGNKVFYKPDFHDGKATITKYTFNLKDRYRVEMVASVSGDISAEPVTIKIKPELNGFFFQYEGKDREYRISDNSGSINSDYYLMDYSENGQKRDKYRFYFDYDKAKEYLKNLIPKTGAVGGAGGAGA